MRGGTVRGKGLSRWQGEGKSGVSGKGRSVQNERETCLSDARGHEMRWLGTRLARQGTRASSSDSTAGSELHDCLPPQQVSAYKTPQSPRQAVASSGVGPLEALWGPTISPLPGGFQRQPWMMGRDRWGEGGIRGGGCSLRPHGEDGQSWLHYCHVPGTAPQLYMCHLL